MSEYIISIKELAILLAKCNGTKLVEEDGTPICDPSEIAKGIDDPIVLKELVRCRDCEFGAYDGNECMRVDEWDDSFWFPVEPDGFCAWAKRWEP